MRLDGGLVVRPRGLVSGAAQEPVWLLDDAVISEPLSASRFPDHQGKYREFCDFRPREADCWHRKAARLRGFLTEFPGPRNREFLQAIREFKFADRLLSRYFPRAHSMRYPKRPRYNLLPLNRVNDRDRPPHNFGNLKAAGAQKVAEAKLVDFCGFRSPSAAVSR
jgi:hypothetical protein